MYNKVTLQKPKLCKFLMILPMLLCLLGIVGITAICSWRHDVPIVILTVLLVIVFCILLAMQAKKISTPMTILSIMISMQKEGALVDDGKSLWKTWSQMTLSAFIADQNRRLHAFDEELKTMSQSMKTGEIRWSPEKDGIYYCENQRVLFVGTELDEENERLLHLIATYQTWDYLPKGSSSIPVEYARKLQALIEKFVTDEGYIFDYN